MKLDPRIFKAYDIRGIYPEQLDEEGAKHVALGFATWLKRQRSKQKNLTVVVGRDMRTSSPSLHKHVIAGLVESGVQVMDIGLASTPTLYFAVAYHGYDGGIQVSASHNPKEYNGLKLVRERAVAIGRETGMNDLQDQILHGDFAPSFSPGRITKVASITELVFREQTKYLKISSMKPFTVVADAANAMGAVDIETMFQFLPGTLIPLNFQLDGSFPSHQPDPLDPENLQVLQEAVIKHKADIGIAPDGDGDRYFFIDDHGQVVRQEILRGIMAQVALQEHPGAKVCYDIRPGRITQDMIEAVGGRAVVTPVGHSLIKAVMVKENAIFGGESSGHYFYQFPYGTFEAPMVLVVRFLLWLSQQDKPLSAAIKPYQKYFHSGEINSSVSNPQAVLQKMKAQYSDAKISQLDGITVEYPEWWFNVRASNTEPLVRLNLEAKTQMLMREKQAEVLTLIRS